MHSEEERRVRRALAETLGLKPAEAETAMIRRLEGLTNRVYAVDFQGCRYALRLPGSGTARIIDRKAEEANARRAAAAGVAPEVLYFSSEGVMLTTFVEGSPLTPERLRKETGAIRRAADAFRRLHETAEPFVRAFTAFETMASYVGILEHRSFALPSGTASLLADAQRIRAALDATPVAPKPSHCDPTGRNLLDTGERVWMVDWEYSGQNDPAWDLAYFSLESQLDETDENALLVAHFGREPQPGESARLAVTKPVCLLLSALWALVQSAAGNPALDFDAYARDGFERAAALMTAPEFAHYLVSIRSGDSRAPAC